MKVNRSFKLYSGIIVAIGILLLVLKITLHPSLPPSKPVADIQLNTMIPINTEPVHSSPPLSAAPIELKPTMRWYDPAAIRIGDQVAEWKVTDKQQETYGKGSVAYTMEGEATISGSFTVYYEDADYNSNQIVFIADEESSLGLPQPLAFKGNANRMILQLSNTEDQKKLGIPGSTGRATIVIHKYFSVYAEILEGVSDAAEVVQIKMSETTPPPATEVAQASFDKALEPFPLFPLNPTEITETASLSSLQEWLTQVNQQFSKSISSFNFKRINLEQRDQLQKWLTQAFTETKAQEILAEHAPHSGIHYLLTSGTLGLKPYGEIKDMKNQELKVDDSQKTLTYKTLYILTGTNDAQLTCVLKQVDGKWKIHQYTIKLI